MKSYVCLIIFINIFFHQTVLTQSPAQLSELSTAINHNTVYNYNRTLAKNFSGRLTGDSGFTNAAEWTASKFKSWNLKPIDRKFGYLQQFSVPYTLVKSASMTLTLPALTDTSKEEIKQLRIGEDFLPLLYTDKGEIDCELVFAGWGICAPELGYDDYAGINVKGKIVLCFRGTPKDDSLFTYYDEHRTRMQTAREKGVAALFYIYNDPIANPNGDFTKDFTPAIISNGIADLILAARGWSVKTLQDHLTKGKQPISFSLSAKVKYKVTSEYHADGIGYNVVGYIEGSDPKLKQECIVVGAHLDHCGTHVGLTFEGANDNASGSAVVMAIAEAFAKSKRPPKRSIAFVLFGAEESGLQGSKYFINHLPKQFPSVMAMINFDMVGEGDGARCGFSAEPKWIKDALDSADRSVNIVKGSRPIREIGVSSSDFASFFRKGIPCLSFYSNGPHLYYHQAGDTIYRINPDILADIARVGLLCASIIANL